MVFCLAVKVKGSAAEMVWMGSRMWIAPSGGWQCNSTRSVRGREIEVKGFDGADMFTRDINRRETGPVGKQNLVLAQEVLPSDGRSLKVSDVGGRRGRKILLLFGDRRCISEKLTKVNDPDIKWYQACEKRAVSNKGQVPSSIEQKD